MPSICKHRGPLLLHAAKSWDDHAVGWLLRTGLVQEADAIFGEEKTQHPAGIIFACTTVLAHLTPEGGYFPDRNGEKFLGRGEPQPPPPAEVDRRWHMRGQFGLVLGDVMPTKNVACKGALGLWDVPDKVLAELGMLDCAACGRTAQGEFGINRDGFGVGPEVPLCNSCGSHELPNCEQIWEAIQARRSGWVTEEGAP